MIHCGSTFTVAGTIENTILLWGTRAVSPSTRPNTQEGFTNSWGQDSVLGSAGSNVVKDPEFHFDEMAPINRDGKEPQPEKGQKDVKMRDVIHQPQEILA